MTNVVLTCAASVPDVRAAATTIARSQGANGMIAWFPGGHGDPWNHVEAAMALTIGGELEAARRAFDWLRAVQRADGAFHASYLANGSVEDERLDSNLTAYVAVGVLHHVLATGDDAFAEANFAMVERAIEFALSLQRPGGEVVWSRSVDGLPGDFALLAGSSSIYLSLRAAVALAALVERPHRQWSLAATRLSVAIREREGAFADKSVFAMDWYYPVLCGALQGPAAVARLESRRDRFVRPGEGARSRADGRWVTTAETAECALAHAGAGAVDLAAELLATTVDKRRPDGGYLTGLVYPERSSFPTNECTTYSTAAVLIAADALAGGEATCALFMAEGAEARASSAG